MDLVHLVQLVVSREQWEQSEHFKVDAADSPVVHLMVIVAVCEQTLRWAVPSG